MGDLQQFFTQFRKIESWKLRFKTLKRAKWHSNCTMACTNLWACCLLRNTIQTSSNEGWNIILFIDSLQFTLVYLANTFIFTRSTEDQMKPIPTYLSCDRKPAPCWKEEQLLLSFLLWSLKNRSSVCQVNNSDEYEKSKGLLFNLTNDWRQFILGLLIVPTLGAAYFEHKNAVWNGKSKRTSLSALGSRTKPQSWPQERFIKARCNQRWWHLRHGADVTHFNLTLVIMQLVGSYYLNNLRQHQLPWINYFHRLINLYRHIAEGSRSVMRSSERSRYADRVSSGIDLLRQQMKTGFHEYWAWSMWQET